MSLLLLFNQFTTYNQSITDSVSVSDSISKLDFEKVLLDEALAYSDISRIDYSGFISKHIDDYVYLTEDIIKYVEQELKAEVIDVTDSISKRSERTFIDAVTLTDALISLCENTLYKNLLTYDTDRRNEVLGLIQIKGKTYCRVCIDKLSIPYHNMKYVTYKHTLSSSYICDNCGNKITKDNILNRYYKVNLKGKRKCGY